MKTKISASALKHEAFVLALLAGNTAADAARKAGYGRKDVNARIIAWELLQRPDIRARLAELIEATSGEAIMTAIQRKIRLSEIARASYDDKDRDSDPIVAIMELNRMDGVYRQRLSSVAVPPITNVTVEETRQRITQTVEVTDDEASGERHECESDDELTDRRPLLEEGRGGDTKNSQEVQIG